MCHCSKRQNKFKQLNHLKNAPSLWSLKQNFNFLYILLSDEVISCTPLLQTDLLFPFIWPRSATRPREGSRRLVISLTRQRPFSSPISRKWPAPASGKASPSWGSRSRNSKIRLIVNYCMWREAFPNFSISLLGPVNVPENWHSSSKNKKRKEKKRHRRIKEQKAQVKSRYSNHGFILTKNASQQICPMQNFMSN